MIGRIRGVPVEELFGEAFQRTTQKQRERGESDGNSQQDPMTEAADEAKHGANPYRRGCRQAGDVTGGIPQNHAGPQKADAGQYSLNDAAERIRVGGQAAVGRSDNQDDNGSGTQTDERVSAEAGWFSVQLAIQTEDRSDNQGGAEAQGGFFISA